MSPADRARTAHAAAEAARDAGADPRDVAALRAAASLWERVAGPGVEWSTRRLQADLRQLRIDVAVATGPFQPPQPPKAPPPAAEPLEIKYQRLRAQVDARPQEAAIEF